MSGPRTLLSLQDMDLLIQEMNSAEAQARLGRLGLARGEVGPLEKQRARLVAGLDRRWQRHYERAQARYGRGVVGVRERVCQGCRITLPTSAAPGAGEVLTLCESCGRILYWG
jgi:predicted  nucleic acid-binding Zn-ribbon protein